MRKARRPAAVPSARLAPGYAGFSPRGPLGSRLWLAQAAARHRPAGGGK